VLRVAVDANCLAWGWSGIPKHVDRISRELVQLDVELVLLANTDRPFASIPEARQFYARRRGGAIWRNTFVASWVRRHKPDVFWAPETVTPVRLSLPSVVTVHDVGPLLLGDVKPLRHRLAFRTSIPRSIRRAARVAVVSETTAADVRRLWGIPADVIRIVPNGVDERFTPGDRDAAAANVRARWGLAQPYALFVGTLEPRKGVEVLLSALRAARGRGTELNLVLVGAAGFRGEELEREAVALGARVLHGVSDEELPDLYRAAQALAAPSLYEGFGLTPLEAMACGTPAVIAEGAGALGEVSGAAAISVASREPGAWLEAILGAGSRRGELEQRGLELAQRFRWPDVARRMRAVLEEAAGA
jgi:glycosyltransferase involved in cell wall biosynthesis